MNKIKVELVIGFTILIITFFISGYFDILEGLTEWSRKYEQYEMDELLSTAIVLIFLLLIFSVRRLLELKNRTRELELALNEIETLRGIIPICSYCKEIRDEEGIWNQLEAYIQSHSSAEFSHGICPKCFNEQKGKLDSKSSIS